MCTQQNKCQASDNQAEQTVWDSITGFYLVSWIFLSRNSRNRLSLSLLTSYLIQLFLGYKHISIFLHFCISKLRNRSPKRLNERFYQKVTITNTLNYKTSVATTLVSINNVSWFISLDSFYVFKYLQLALYSRELMVNYNLLKYRKISLKHTIQNIQ